MTQPDDPRGIPHPGTAPQDPRSASQEVGVTGPTGRRRARGVLGRVASHPRLTLGAALLVLVAAGGTLTAVGTSLHDAPELGHPTVMSAPGEIAETSDCAPTSPIDPSAKDRLDMEAVSAQHFAVSTANPLASEAACRVLAEGGSAADGLVAAQAVLGLVEPQSSGFGGGGFAMYYDAKKDRTTTYDGMETAPDNAEPTDLTETSSDDSSAPEPNVRASGRSIGVPGVGRMLGAIHDAHGARSWADGLAPAHQLAQDGFVVSKRLEDSVRYAKDDLKKDPDAEAYLMPDGRRVREGDLLRNPDYAATLDALADGPDALYSGPLADAIVSSATSEKGGRTPSRMEAGDLENYSATEGSPLCIRYRDAQLVCTPHATEDGGTAVLSAMGILSNVDLPGPDASSGDGQDPAGTSAHLIAEAERLALADRSAYSADQGFVAPPDDETFSLVDPGYLAQRATLIDPDRNMDEARPGKEPSTTDDEKEEGTSHVSIVDADGNMASMTTSLQSDFGSYHMAGGFFLNNHLENFASDPEKDGQPVANALAGGKRPRTAMAPTMVFSAREDGSIGTPFLATGSPGGSEITSYVVKNLVAMLDWGMDPQQAAGMRNVGAVSRSESVVESGWGETAGKAGDSLLDGLEGKGPDPTEGPMPSGTATILRDGDRLVGGADPRREGEVRGG